MNINNINIENEIRNINHVSIYDYRLYLDDNDIEEIDYYNNDYYDDNDYEIEEK